MVSLTSARAAFAVACAFVSFLPSMAAPPTATRNLTFEDRVAAQRAIEEVYWRHRIWPNDTRAPTLPC